jgi:hypothetical protein
MGLYFLKCEVRGCSRENNLVGCAACLALVCPRHVVNDGNRAYCPKCAKSAPFSVPATHSDQLNLFPRVRPRSKRSALDGLQR